MSKYTLPSGQEIEKEDEVAPDLQIVQERINDVLEVLGDFKNRREEGRPRGEYVKRLIKDMCTYYGYNEFLMTKFYEIFPKQVSAREGEVGRGGTRVKEREGD